MTRLKLGLFGFLFVFGIVALFGSYTIIPSGYRGVVTHFGKVQDEILDEGIHLKLPFVTSIHEINVRVQATQAKTEAASKDIQKVTAEVTINWGVNANEVNKLYQSVGDEEAVTNNIINPAVSEVLKAATSKRTAEEILTHRLELKSEIDEMLKVRLAKYNLIVRDISLTDLDFTKEFNHAVEQKQIAEQQAKQAEYTALKAKQDAIAAVNEAEGQAQSQLKLATAQAEAQKLMQRTITPEILQLEFYKKWDGSFPQVLVNGSGTKGGMPMMLNITPSSSKKSSSNSSSEE